MEIRYGLAGSARKGLVEALERMTGSKAAYMRMPTCAYEVGPFTVTKGGALQCGDAAELGRAVKALAEAGFAAEDNATEDTTKTEDGTTLDVMVPQEGDGIAQARNLANLVHSRQALLNRMTGAESFRLGGGTMQAVAEARDMEALAAVLNGSEGVKVAQGMAGLRFPADPERSHAYAELAALMAGAAARQKRISAKPCSTGNEKYAARTWLVRLGMSGPAYKETRRILLEGLTGNSAFRTGEQAEAARRKQGKGR